MTGPVTAEAPRLAMRGIRKRFGATLALDGVDLDVAPGEIHALLGENGAGKSTLMKLLSGALRPDEGVTRLDGVAYAPRDPLEARRRGVAMIYQELNLAPDLTIEENVSLGAEVHRFGLLRRGAWTARISATLARLLRPDLAPDLRVGDLAPGERQIVEIARALLLDARLLIMDEPTSSLGQRETEHLFEVIRGLRDDGVAVVYISHFLDEILGLADRYTVLRDGATVATGAVAATSAPALVEAMIGRRLEELFPRVPRELGEEILHVESLSGRARPVGVDLRLRRGEILGIAGLVGAGRTELLRTLFGLDPIRSGRVRIGGVAVGRPSPYRSVRLGMGLVSEDRAGEGLAVDRSIAENVLLGRLGALATGGWVSRPRLRRAAEPSLRALGVKANGVWQEVRALSGGNQQKVALARWLHDDVDVLLLDEPTRGIDVAAKAEIYRLIGEAAAKGRGVILVSSQNSELLGVCDRVAVMHRGRLGPARPVADWTEHALLSEATSGATTP